MTDPLCVLVTGATGKQGGALARLLLQRGHRVHALTRNPESPAAAELKSIGAEITGRFLRDTASTRFFLTKGAGDSTITAVFRNSVSDAPQVGQFYCPGVRNVNQSAPTLPALETTQICVTQGSTGPVVVSTDQDITLGTSSIDLSKSNRIILRLSVLDSENRVTPVYSEDGGLSFKTFTKGTIFTKDTSFSIFVQGAVSLPFIDDPHIAKSSTAARALGSAERIAQTPTLRSPPPPGVIKHSR